MAGQPWTSDELEILKQMADAGKTSKEISMVLVGRSIMAIESKSSELALSLAGPKPVIDLEAFKRLMQAESEIKCL